MKRCVPCMHKPITRHGLPTGSMQMRTVQALGSCVMASFSMVSWRHWLGTGCGIWIRRLQCPKASAQQLKQD